MRFPGFDDEWTETTLGEICTFSGGGTPSSQNQSYWDGNIPWVSSSDIQDGNISNVSITRHITLEAIQDSSTKLCKAPCILIVSRVGVGKVAYSEIDICTSQDFCILTEIQAQYRFLAYLLQPLMKQKSLEVQGTSIKGITIEEIKRLPLSLPSLAEQEKIASFLSLLDERIACLSETIKEYKSLRSATIKEISSRIVEWDSLEFLVDNGAILLKRGEIIPKSEYSSTNQYPVYSSSVKNKGLMGYTDKFMFEDERITWSIDGGGDLFYRYPHKYSVTNVCGILEILGEYDYRFLCAILQGQHLRLRFDYQTKAHPSVIVKLYKVPRIHLEQQVYYGALFASIDERIEVEEQLLRRYEEQKQYLLRQMFV